MHLGVRVGVSCVRRQREHLGGSTGVESPLPLLRPFMPASTMRLRQLEEGVALARGYSVNDDLGDL